MGVELVRIDDRLVHGQILKNWIKELKPTQITVVNDCLANNLLRKTIIELSLPRDVKLEVLSVGDMAKRGDISQLSTEREIILFGNPADVLEAVNGGLRFTKLNLGGVHHFNGDKVLTTNISLTQDDVDDLKTLLEQGLDIKVYALPKDREIDLRELL